MNKTRWLRFALVFTCLCRVSAQGWGQAGGAPAGAGDPPGQMPALGALSVTNPFDAKRQVWPDRTPPPAPPSAPAPITSEEVEVYGVVLAGGVQKALLKLGGRFKAYPVGPSGLASVPVGGSLGEFYLAQVQADQVLFKSAASEQWVRFGGKSDRSGAGGAVPPASSAQNAGGVPAAAAPLGALTQGAQASGLVGASAVAADAASVAGGGHSASAVPAAAALASPPDAGNASLAVNSLAAAIAAARASQQASGGVGGATANPFDALLNRR